MDSAYGFYPYNLSSIQGYYELKFSVKNLKYGYVGERLNPIRCQRRECQFKSGRNRHTPLVQWENTCLTNKGSAVQVCHGVPYMLV